MTPFDVIIVTDWSGGNDRGPKPKPDAIWAAVARAGRVEPAQYFRNRQEYETWLTGFLKAALAEGSRVLAGFDFPFAYSAGFGRALTGQDDPFAVWDWLEKRIEDSPRGNNRFAVAGQINAKFDGIGPFWGNAGRADVPHLPRKGTERTCTRFAEKRRVEALAKGAFSCWQLAGAGSVGSQVLMGLPMLGRLRRTFGAELGVAGFGALGGEALVLTEIWPSLLAQEVRKRQGSRIKDAVQVEVLAGALAAMKAPDITAMLAQGDAEEGWITGLGDAALREAAEALPIPGQDPPPLTDDCFALPPGVSWLPVDEALARLRSRLGPVTGPLAEMQPLASALGGGLARAPVAARANPPAPNAAVDGYGFAHASVAGAEGPLRLPLVDGRAAAGAPFAGAVPAGQAIRILTGALLPEGVDTVVLEEDTTCGEGYVAFRGPVKPGANARKAGEDVAVGAALFPAGHRLTAPDLALLAATGVNQVSLLRPLRVGVLSTGDELCAPAPDTPPSKTHDANRPMLLSVIRQWGYAPVDLGLVGDDAGAVRRRLDKAARDCDVVLTSGGASAGDEDHISALLRREGNLTAWRIALKPGRPLALGQWQGVPVFGLPGNPVAALICTLIFARPALSLMAGGRWLEAQGFMVPAGFSKRKKPGRREYLRARLTPEGAAEVFPSEGSGRISGLSWADGLVELPDGALDVAPGTPVRYIPYAMLGLSAG
ncbi:molybdopterin molybdenumtransferase MoeA [Alphaproteobacteria bacterium KMM 3653]|uniref:Molybdopterin molybdenumtransferase n=1 Tax=Harenicola maris TaxID=2841044 RepID=A0AAP2CQJ5_9RHOB|nr:molybdopterin molybdenumtransferase MoeA [Harenicola maris]